MLIENGNKGLSDNVKLIHFSLSLTLAGTGGVMQPPICFSEMAQKRADWSSWNLA